MGADIIHERSREVALELNFYLKLPSWSQGKRFRLI